MRLNYKLTKSLLLFFLLLAGSTVIGQTVTINTSPSGSQNIGYGPFRYHAGEHLYLQTEINTAGLINRVGFDCSTLAGAYSYQNVSIYLKETTAITLGTGTYSLTGYLLVYNGNVTVNSTGYTMVTLNTFFNYTNTAGNNLQLLVIVNPTSAPPANPINTFASSNNITGGNKSRRYNSALTAPSAGASSLASSAFRAALRLEMNLPQCSGTPSPGATNASSSLVCLGGSIALSLANPQSNLLGISYQWQSSPDDIIYAPITGATNSTATVTPSGNTYYRCNVSCSFGSSNTSNPVFVTATSVFPLPFIETFNSAVPPSPCWSRNNATYVIYNAVSGYGVGTGSAKFDFFNAPANADYDLITAEFTGVPANYMVEFDYAYATFVDEVDSLVLQYSMDGGTSFTDLVFIEGGATGVLNTGGRTTTAYTPTAGQWSTFRYALPVGTNKVRFLGRSQFGNNLYIDNVEIKPAILDEAQILNIFTYGNLPLNYADGHVVRAKVKNTGANSWTKTFDLEITGANTFNTTASLTLNPGEQSEISFPGFTATSIGTQTAKVTAPLDNIADNSADFDQIVSNNLFSYKESTSTISGGVGFTGVTGNFVAKFTASQPSVINEIKVDFTTGGNSYKYAIWNNDGSGGVGDTLWTSAASVTVAGQQFLPVPNIAVNGDFFVGIKQTGTVNVGFAYQTELPVRTNSFFYNSPESSNTGWTDFQATASPFRFAIEVQLDVPVAPNCVINHSPANGTGLCGLTPTLNWASGGGGPTSYDVYFGTTYPPAFAANVATTSYAPGTLTDGVLYYWLVIAKNGIGDAIGCDTLSFTAQAVPTGNTLADPIVVGALPYTTSGNNLATNCFSNTLTVATNQASPDVFYKITTGPCTDSILVSLCASPAFDGYVHVLDALGNEIDDDDDGCGTIGGPSLLKVDIAPNSIYFVVVEGWTTTQGTYSLSITEIDNPVLTVNPTASSATLCTGDDVTLSGNISPSGTYTILWTGPLGTYNTEDVLLENIDLSYGGNYGLLVTDAAGCSASGNVNLIINTKPIVTAGANTNFCSGTADLNLTADLSGGTYAWSGPNAFSSALEDPSIVAATDLATGTYTLYFTDGNGCKDTSTVATTIFPLPLPEVISLGSNGTTYCTGDPAFDLTTSAPFDGYLWNTTETGNFISISSGGTYSVTVTDGNGCQNNDGILINEFALPTAPIVTPGGPLTLCSSDGGNTFTSVTLSVSNYSGTGINWSNGTNPNLNSTTFDQPGQGYATYTDGNGCTSISNFVDLNPRLVSTEASGITANDTALCAGGNTTLTVVGGILEDADTWNWYAGSCSGSSLGSGTSIVVTPATTTTYFVRAEGSCGVTLCANGQVVVFNAPPGGTAQNPTLPSSGCQGNSFVVSTSAISGATYYQWSAPAGTTINGQPSPVITSSPTATIVLGPYVSSGWYICVQGGNPCGTTLNTKCGWIRGTVSTPGSISGNTLACTNTSGTYSISPVVGAESYTWSITGDATVVGSGTSVTVNFGPTFVNGTLSVTANLSCGFSSTPRTLAISTATPQPAAIIGNATACPGGTVTYSIPAVVGAASYNWNACLGATVVNNGTSADITFPSSFSVCVISVTANSSCGSISASRSKSIANGSAGIPANIIGANSNLCGANAVSYSCAAVANATSYTWSIIGGSIQSGNGSSSVSVNWTNSGTTASISVSANNGCGSSTARTLPVRLIPGVPSSITTNNSVLVGDVESASIPSLGTGVVYTWSTSPSGIGITSQGSNNIQLDYSSTAPGLYTIVCVPSNSCGASNTRTTQVNVVASRKAQSGNGATIHSMVYPNPATNVINVSFTSSIAGEYGIKLTDLSGRVVLNSNGASMEGQNLINLPTNQLAKGVYMLTLETGTIREINRIVIQ